MGAVNVIADVFNPCKSAGSSSPFQFHTYVMVTLLMAITDMVVKVSSGVVTLM